MEDAREWVKGSIEKTVEEWIEIFNAKHQYALSEGLKDTPPHEFYRELFPVGTLQAYEDRATSNGKGCIIATQIRTQKMKEKYPNERTHCWNVYDDLEYIDKVVGDRFGLIPPVSFYGTTHKQANAHELFAFAIDIDYVDKTCFRDLIHQCKTGFQLMPTYIVSSGKGVHVYYFLKEPVPLYKKYIQGVYKDIKRALIRKLWNGYTSLSDKPDAQSVTEGMRCVGSQTKLRQDICVKAYKISDARYSIEELAKHFNDYNLKEYAVDMGDYGTTFQPKVRQLTFDDLAELKSKSAPKRGYWVCKRDLYEWWKGRIEKDAVEGGRYFTIMALCAFGLKCGVDVAEIKEDAYGYVPMLDARSNTKGRHFTKSDVDDALTCLIDENREHLTHIAGREWISEKTKIEIKPTHRPRGKRLKQDRHLKLARMKLEIMNEENGENLQGRKPMAWRVSAWRLANPNGTKMQCHRDTGLSRVTIDKWWN